MAHSCFILMMMMIIIIMIIIIMILMITMIMMMIINMMLIMIITMMRCWPVFEDDGDDNEVQPDAAVEVRVGRPSSAELGPLLEG